MSEIGFMVVVSLQLQQGHELKEFNSLYKELDEIYHKIAFEIGLSDSAFFIMYSMAELGGGCLQKDIADRYFISRKTINSSIKNLEAKGYLILKRGNRRDMHLYLTEAGEKLVQEKIAPVFQLENSIFDDMSKEESRLLLDLTRKYLTLCRQKVEEKYHLSSHHL